MPLQLAALQLLVNPTVASLLLFGGLLGVAIELLSPGGIAPGALGAIALVLGLYGSAQLPLSAAGIVLLLLAVALLVAETQVASGGILGGAGVAALVAGVLLLYDTDSEALAVSLPVALAAGALLGAFTLFAAVKAAAARRSTPRGAAHELVGAVGVVRTPLAPVGQVFVRGSLWRARGGDHQPRLEAGRRVQVDVVDGLTLTVRAVGPDDNHDKGKDAR